MGLFKKEEVVLFSGFEGRILNDGEPVTGAKVTRTYELYENQEDSAITDENGFFSFETVKGKYSDSFMTQFVVTQKIHVQHNNINKKIWFCGKLSRDEYSEFDGKPENLVCDLHDNLIRVDLKNGFAGTSCKWTTNN